MLRDSSIVRTRTQFGHTRDSNGSHYRRPFGGDGDRANWDWNTPSATDRGRVLGLAASRPISHWVIRDATPSPNRANRDLSSLLKRPRFDNGVAYWKRGVSAREKMTTSSPVTVLMSWCMLTTFTPVTS